MALVESRHNQTEEDSEPFTLSRSENDYSEDGFNPAVTKILGIPRSPIVSEAFMIPAQVHSQSGGSSDASSSSPEEREPVSTRAISPPSSTSLTVISAGGGSSRKSDKSTSPTTSVTVVNGMIHDPNYQELCQQLMHLGVGPSSPVEQGFTSQTLTQIHSPPAVHTGSYASPKRVHQITSPAAGGGAGGGIGILSGQSDDSVLTLRLLMSGRDTGSVIGKGGNFIKTVRERSSARVNISSDSFSTERMVTITGGINAINTAVMMMASRLENDYRQLGMGLSTVSQLQFRLVVPTSQCGSLIGRAGTKIKEIREVCFLLRFTVHAKWPMICYLIQQVSGANIQVSGEALPNSSERVVTVSGGLTAISDCIKQICLVMLESPPKGPVQQYIPPSADQISRNSQLSGINSAPPSAAAFANESTMSQQMKIPNDLIGCVIGRKGAKINEIRLMSGAQIKISNNEGDLVERTVTMTGSPGAVSIAQYLIGARIQSEVTGIANFGLM